VAVKVDLPMMQIGLIGAGNMARAMARGWGDPVLCSDSGSGRAQALAQELGGRAASNLEVAQGADLIVLCHKPYQLHDIAREVREAPPRAIVSVLGATPLERLTRTYPETPVFRIEPNTPVEVGRGVLLYAGQRGADAELERAVIEHFERLGWVAQVSEDQLGAAAAVSAVGPAYLALVAEAQVDAAIRHGLKPDLAGRLAAETMAGAAEVLTARGYDTLTVRREVTSPGGSTARGLRVLEAHGLRDVFSEAMDAVDKSEKLNR
jgi:pyrroline-5-carboxylate reductase